MTELKPRQKLAAALCSAAILAVLVAGCGNSPEDSSTGAAGAGTTSGGVERTDNDSGKTGGTPNSHLDKNGEGGKESGG